MRVFLKHRHVTSLIYFTVSDLALYPLYFSATKMTHNLIFFFNFSIIFSSTITTYFSCFSNCVVMYLFISEFKFIFNFMM